MFFRDVALLFRRDIIKPADGTYRINTYGLFKNYFKVGVRNLLKYKLFSFINIFGLAAAMSVCMLLVLMLLDQGSYDAFHQDRGRIFRIITAPTPGDIPHATVAWPLVNSLRSTYSLAEKATGLRLGFGGDLGNSLETTEVRGFFAEKSLFQVLNFPLTQGSPSTALSQPRSIVITESVSSRLFPDGSAMGKTVHFDSRGLYIIDMGGDEPTSDWGDFIITGIVDDKAFKSHLKFDVLASASTLPVLHRNKLIDNLSDNWDNYFESYAYVKLRTGYDQKDLNSALATLANSKYDRSGDLQDLMFTSQSIEDVTPGEALINEPSFRLPMSAYYILGILALIVMVMAGLNYTNLAIARSLTRMKEIGIRKVTGANVSNLAFQFLTESVLTTFLATLAALLILFFLRKAFMELWLSDFMRFDLQWSSQAVLIFAIFSLFTGIAAGLYPALVLARKRPVDSLKKATLKAKNWSIPKVLNVGQFAISLIFIVSSIVVYKQFDHYMNYEYGFTAENLINLRLQSNDYRQLKTEIEKIPGVSGVSACQFRPAMGNKEEIRLVDKENEEEAIALQLLYVDENFLDNLRLKIIAGQGLPNIAGLQQPIVINESAVSKLGFDGPHEALGEIFESVGNKKMKIIGVVQDFQATLLFSENKQVPAVLINDPTKFSFLNVKVEGADLASLMSNIEEVWHRIDPAHDFDYGFYKEELASTNYFIRDIVGIVAYMALLAAVIAILGLLGIATYSTKRKMKEIAIRKVLGAADLQIIMFLSKNFISLLLIATCIAAPLSYFFNRLWLDNLSNRVEFDISMVVLATLMLLGAGLVTIGSQTLKAARTNPVDSLKHE